MKPELIAFVIMLPIVVFYYLCGSSDEWILMNGLNQEMILGVLLA